MSSFVKGSDMTQCSILGPGEEHTGFHEFMALEDIQAELIPRIIHQIYRTSEIVRDDWREAHGTWIAMNVPSSNWTHLLWTDEIAKRFVLTEWPGFIDAVRYMNERLVFLQLYENIDEYAFTSSLMPKLGALVDFSHPLEIFILNYDGVSLDRLRFNCETISASA
ncbi:MAG: hypothetical protein EOO61_18760 [Hymenobacter sp.]|nr:MAG: hypothetical protein EOO61_18760 [Hymenobacter sp.]